MAGFWRRLFGGASESSDTASELTSGTKATDLQVVDVIDGDTLRVMINDKEESLRLLCVDTEESRSGGNKPVTNAGKIATEKAKEYFQAAGGGWCKVDIEFESDAPLEECLEQQRGNYGRLICYVYKDGENYNLHTIKEGWSPYFVKYGHARFFHKEFLAAEASAQAANKLVWDPTVNEGGATRDYAELMPWWTTRGSLVEWFRRQGRARGAYDAREDYPKLLEAMQAGTQVKLFADLQGGLIWVETGALIQVGAEDRPFSLWFPNAKAPEKEALIRLLNTRYTGHGRGYVYVTGKVTTYKNKPQIVVDDISQLSDLI